MDTPQQAIVNEPAELIAQLQEVEALLLHDTQHQLPQEERWAGDEARRILRRLIAPHIIAPDEQQAITLSAEQAALATTSVGITLRPPAGFEGYGGAGKNFYPDAAGWYFFGQVARGPRGFGTYVWRQKGTAVAEELNYGPLMPGRGTLMLGGDGVLYVSGSYDGSNFCTVFTVPGYTRFTPNGPMPTPIPIVTPVIDQDARNMAAAAQQTAKDADRRAGRAESAAAAAQTTADHALAVANQPHSGLDVPALKNELWNDLWYRSDMLYYWLSPGVISPGVEERLGAIAVDAVALATPAPELAALKQQVTELETLLAALNSRITSGAQHLLNQP